MWDIWRTTNLIGMIIVTVCMCACFAKRLGPFLVVTWAYFLLRALMVFENPIAEFPRLGTQLDQTSGQAFAQLLVIPLAVLLMPKNIFKHWINFFSIFALVDSGLLAIFGYGLMNASSFDAGMIMVILPLLQPIVIVICLVCLLFSFHLATAIVVFVSQLGASAMRDSRHTALKIYTGILILLAAYAFLPQVHHFDSSHRLDAWQRFFEWWMKNASWTFGTGTGTFQWLGPLIDGLLDGKTGEMFIQMHNDWFQVLFEGGAIGFAFVAMSYIDLVIRSWKQGRLFVAVIGLGVFCLTYHPLRFFPSALFICCLIRAVMEKE